MRILVLFFLIFNGCGTIVPLYSRVHIDSCGPEAIAAIDNNRSANKISRDIIENRSLGKKGFIYIIGLLHSASYEITFPDEIIKQTNCVSLSGRHKDLSNFAILLRQKGYKGIALCKEKGSLFYYHYETLDDIGWTYGNKNIIKRLFIINNSIR